MSVRSTVKGLIHEELFFLEPSVKQAFKRAPLEQVRRVFSQNDHVLGSNPELIYKGSRKWKLLDGKKTYLRLPIGKMSDGLDAVMSHADIKFPYAALFLQHVARITDRIKMGRLYWGNLRLWAVFKQMRLLNLGPVQDT